MKWILLASLVILTGCIPKPQIGGCYELHANGDWLTVKITSVKEFGVSFVILNSNLEELKKQEDGYSTFNQFRRYNPEQVDCKQ